MKEKFKKAATLGSEKAGEAWKALKERSKEAARRRLEEAGGGWRRLEKAGRLSTTSVGVEKAKELLSRLRRRKPKMYLFSSPHPLHPLLSFSINISIFIFIFIFIFKFYIYI